MTTTTSPPTSYGVLIFPGFEVLDIAGPLECLNMLTEHLPPSSPIPSLAIIGRPDPSNPSHPLPITPAAPSSIKPNAPSSPFKSAQIYLPTHTFANAPHIDILLVPGGMGTRNPHVTCPEELAYIKAVFPRLQHLFTICTGSLLCAAAGILDNHRATSNKSAFKTAAAAGPRVHWIAKARWVDDGKVWTTSGVSAGIDGMLAFMEGYYGEEVVGRVGDAMEYRRVRDSGEDEFAEVWGVEDVLPVVE